MGTRSLVLLVILSLTAVPLVTPMVEAAGAKAGKVTFEPARPQTGDTVKLRLELPDDVERAEIRWFVNDDEAGTSDYYEQGQVVALDRNVKAGDVVKAEVTSFNAGGDPGDRVTKNITILNAPPLLEVAEQRVEESEYRARIEGSDPEGGLVSMALKHGPPGMTMDDNGTITWKVGSKNEGKVLVQVSGKDDKGAEAVLSYTFTIRRPEPSRR